MPGGREEAVHFVGDIGDVGAALFERYGRLDILVGNAAQLGVLSPLGHVPPKVWQDVMAGQDVGEWMDVDVGKSTQKPAVLTIGQAGENRCRIAIIATETALKLSDYVVTEAGFGADLSGLRVKADEEAVEAHLLKIGKAPEPAPAPQPLNVMNPAMAAGGGGGCPGSRAQTLQTAPVVAKGEIPAATSQLRHWPIQLHLVPPAAGNREDSRSA